MEFAKAQFPSELEGRQCIIYGANQNLGEVYYGLLEGPYRLVDGKREKWGKQFRVLGDWKTVESPVILRGLDPQNYYVVITASKEKTIALIKQNIFEIAGNEEILIYEHTCLPLIWHSLLDMLSFDLMVKWKIQYYNIYINIPKFVNKFERIVRERFNGKADNFAMIKAGHHIVFSFDSGGEQYICKLPAHLVHSFENFHWYRTQYWLYQNSSYFDDFTVYQDEDGFLIEHRGEPIAAEDLFRKENVSNIFCTLRKLHALPVSEVIAYDHYGDIDARYSEFLNNSGFSETYKNIAAKMFENYQPVKSRLSCYPVKVTLTHGNLNYWNIVRWKDIFRIIDWESLALRDPIWDVVGFLQDFCWGKPDSIANINSYLFAFLNLYYQRTCTEDEFSHAQDVLMANLHLLCFSSVINLGNDEQNWKNMMSDCLLTAEYLKKGSYHDVDKDILG